MSDLVPPNKIEAVVGVARHATEHWGRAVSAEQTVYILHSAECRASGIDLRDCEFSVALDEGIELSDWENREDQPVRLMVDEGWLVPLPEAIR
jgi:hypothetical protein